MKVALVRGAFLNNFEGQNFIFDQKNISITGFSSLYPIHTTLPFSHIKLPSVSDLGHLPIMKNINLYHSAVKYFSNRTLGDSQILFGLEKQIKGFDVIDTADPFYFYSYQLARMRKSGKIANLIVTYCETIPNNNESVKRKKYIKYFTLSMTDRFICHTELSKKALEKEGIDTDKVKIVHLGVDLSKFTSKKRTASEDINILFAGRLVPEKGILDVYTTFRNLFKKPIYRHVKLQITGSGPLKNKLLEMIRNDGLKNMISIGEKTYEQMPEVYAGADLFILPSKRTQTWEEQYGMVLIEAMACGLPVISTLSGAIPEVVGNAGILVRESDTNMLQKALESVIDNRELRRKMSYESSDRAKRLFDSRKSAEIIGRIYTSMVQGQRD